MGSEIVVLSPHLDDAVLSCWHVLSGPADVEVVNVFTGSPPAGRPPAWWDRVTGATDSVERMRERLLEDGSALELAGRDSANLDLLDAQYRANGSAPALAERVRDAVSPDATVYAPAALGLHPDHALVRDAALGLRDRGQEVRLYADLPHAVSFGWPAWVSGAEPNPYFRVEVLWEQRFEEGGLSLEAMEPKAHALDEAAFERKLEAIRCYRTQVAGIAGEIPLDRLRHEVYWTLEETP